MRLAATLKDEGCGMEIGLFYESVLPERGGCEHYIADLARRLHRDGQAVHLHACRWDASALPEATHFHRLPEPTGPRWLRPWKFAESCLESMRQNRHDVTIGFNKTFGQDILYPQGGLHAASAAHNLLKSPSKIGRWFGGLVKAVDPASRSFLALEKRQYLGAKRPLIVVNSRMVQRHFEEYYDIPPSDVRVLPSAIDPGRFVADDRFTRRHAERQAWGADDGTPVGLMVAMNYRLKGLSPLIRSLVHLPPSKPFRLVVVGSPKFQRYQKLARSLGVADRVHFAGFRADPKDAFFGADFLVHPTFYDPCSLVALEALACGLPVVTTKYNGAAELLTPGKDGLVIDDPHDGPALASAIETLLNGGVRQCFAQAARQAGQRWTFEQHYQQFLGLMRGVARQRAAA